ncbi:hypothetical protein FACS1894147_07610 [Spirochaetia bacterium]|nr:hypothetical protein FACS1894147_07610 [Spirochaetia bacterium]
MIPKIYPNAALPTEESALAEKTIARLKLDNPECRAMRARQFRDYKTRRCSLEFLKQYSPFVHTEIVRQGL